jgi:hypothetical protein
MVRSKGSETIGWLPNLMIDFGIAGGIGGCWYVQRLGLMVFGPFEKLQTKDVFYNAIAHCSLKKLMLLWSSGQNLRLALENVWFFFQRA